MAYKCRPLSSNLPVVIYHNSSIFHLIFDNAVYWYFSVSIIDCFALNNNVAGCLISIHNKALINTLHSQLDGDLLISDLD